MFSEKCIASGAFFLYIIYFELKFCIASGCVWSFSKIGIASGVCFLYFTFSELNICIAFGCISDFSKMLSVRDLVSAINVGEGVVVSLMVFVLSRVVAL